MRYSIYATAAAAAAAAVSTPMSRNNEYNYFAFYYKVPILYFIFLLTAYLHVCLCYMFIYYIIFCCLLYYSTAFIYYFGCVLKMHFKVTESYSCLLTTVLLLLSAHLYFHINLNRSLLNVDWNNSLSICWSIIFVSITSENYIIKETVYSYYELHCCIYICF